MSMRTKGTDRPCPTLSGPLRSTTSFNCLLLVVVLFLIAVLAVDAAPRIDYNQYNAQHNPDHGYSDPVDGTVSRHSIRHQASIFIGNKKKTAAESAAEYCFRYATQIPVSQCLARKSNHLPSWKSLLRNRVRVRIFFFPSQRFSDRCCSLSSAISPAPVSDACAQRALSTALSIDVLAFFWRCERH